jgi:hypothetical protein
MPRFRKRPVEVEAMRLGWDTWNEMCEFAGVGRLSDGKPQGGWIDPMEPDQIHLDLPPRLPPNGAEIGLAIPTPEGVMIAREGWWVIRGVEGELYSCKPTVFARTYEPVEGGYVDAAGW